MFDAEYYAALRLFHELKVAEDKRFWERMDKTVAQLWEILFGYKRGDCTLAHMAAFE